MLTLIHNARSAVILIFYKLMNDEVKNAVIFFFRLIYNCKYLLGCILVSFKMYKYILEAKKVVIFYLRESLEKKIGVKNLLFVTNEVFIWYEIQRKWNELKVILNNKSLMIIKLSDETTK